MRGPYCKFVYNLGGTQVSFQPIYPPVHVPAIWPKSESHINIATSGVKETVVERIDNFLALDFPTIPLSDSASWLAFFNYALAGGQFSFYPDATLTAFTNYTLEDQDGRLAKDNRAGVYSRNLKMRQVVT